MPPVDRGRSHRRPRRRPRSGLGGARHVSGSVRAGAGVRGTTRVPTRRTSRPAPRPVQHTTRGPRPTIGRTGGGTFHRAPAGRGSTAGPPTPYHWPSRVPSTGRRAPAFRRPTRWTRAFAEQQYRARQHTREVRRNTIPRSPDVPRIPLIVDGRGVLAYSPAQRQAVRAAYVSAARARGVPISKLFRTLNQQEREDVQRLSPAIMGRGVGSTGFYPARPGRPGPDISAATVMDVSSFTNLPLAIALHPDRAFTAARAGVAGLVGLGRATYESPGRVASSSYRTARESILGIPQGSAAIVSDIAHGRTDFLDAIVKDYEDRYGLILKNPAEFRRRVKDEYGLTPYVLDAAGVAGGSGQVLGALARSSPAMRAAAALGGRTGRAARVLVEATRKERPALRFTGGEGGVMRQETSRNLFLAAGQHGLDRARGANYSRRVRRAGLVQRSGGRLETRAGGNYTLDSRISALRPGDREVVALPSLRQSPVLRRFAGRAARDLGGSQSKARLMMLSRQGRVLDEVKHATKGFTKDETKAAKYLMQLGATSRNFEAVLHRRLGQIEDARAATGKAITPILRSTNDEAVLIREILADPARYVSDRARAAADTLRDIQLREAALDPGLVPEQELIRRMTPQGRLLDIERQPDVAYFRGVLQQIERDTGVPGLAQHADELAAMHPRERQVRARELRRELEQQLRAAGASAETAKRRAQAFRAIIQEREARGKPLATEEVRAAAAGVREAERALGQAQRRAGRGNVAEARTFGRLAERERIGRPLATPEVARARSELSMAAQRLAALEAKLPPAERRAGRAIGRAEGRETRGRNLRALGAEGRSVELDAQIAVQRDVVKAMQAQLREIEKQAPRLTQRQLAGASDAQQAAEAASIGVSEARARVQAAKAKLEEQLLKAPRVSMASWRRAENLEAEALAARQVRDQVREFEKAFRKVVRASQSREHMGTEAFESAEKFAGRVRAAAEEAGLVEPAYWWSSVSPQRMASLRAVGRGMRAAHGNKQYGGKLFEIGAEEHGLDVYTRGLERNIKRRFQYALVHRNLETHAYEWSRNDGKGMTPHAIDSYMLKHFIDPDTVELVDVRMLPKRPDEAPGMERGAVFAEGEAPDPLAGENLISTTQQAGAAMRRRWKDISPDELRGLGMHRYLVVPREVGETLDAATQAFDSTTARMIEVVLKRTPTRVLLGAFNIPWLTFQMAGNAFLTGIGGGTNPFDIWGAIKFDRHLKNMDPDVHAAWEAHLGITHGHHMLVDETNLGATNKRYVNTWRGIKQSRVMRMGHRVNPLDFFFRVDEKQTNFFRKMLFYNKARKASYRRMGKSWRGIDTGISRLMERVLAQPPDRQMALIAAHGEEFERVAKHVKDFLGDYVSYTPAERFMLSRTIMFYGYLRFSLRFTFYTMPVAHPVMTAILGDIGRLGSQEIKELMGVPSNMGVPANILAQLYVDSTHSVPFGRFNPFLNSLTQLDGLNQAVGMVSPYFGLAADQMFEESSFTGRDWRKGGRQTSASERPSNYYDPEFRARVLARGFGNLFPPFRMAQNVLLPPSQGDEALPWSPSPIEYSPQGTAKKPIDAARREFESVPIAERIRQELVPIVPWQRDLGAKQTNVKGFLKREVEKRANAANKATGRKKKRRRKRKRKSYGSSYGSGSYGSGGSYKSGGYGG